MAVHSYGGTTTATESRSRRPHASSPAPALLGALALLVTSFLLLVFGPVLLAYFEQTLPASTGLPPKAAAAGIALGGAAAMIAVLARMVRDIERHAYACLAPVLAAFSGCVIWGLDVRVEGLAISLKHMAAFGLAISVAAGAAVAHGALGLRLMGWMLSQFPTLTLLMTLWSMSNEASAVTAWSEIDHRAKLVVGLLSATSFVLALFGEATRGLARSTRSAPRRGLQVQPEPHYGTPQAQQMAVVMPAPSLPPETHRVPQLSVQVEEDFGAMLRPQRGLTQWIVAALVATAGVAVAVWWMGADTPGGAVEASVEPAVPEVAEVEAAAATEATTVEAALAAAPEVAAPAEPTVQPLRPTVEPLIAHDEGAEPTQALATPDADEAPPTAAQAEPTPPTLAVGVADDDEDADEEVVQAEPAAAAASKSVARQAAAQKRAERARAARARRTQQIAARREAAARAQREAAARKAQKQAKARARRPAAKPQTPAPKAEPAAAPEPKAAPAPKPPAPPVDSSIESLMRGAVGKRGGGAERADDPIFGL